MHVLAIVSRDLEKGSTKYRLAQYLDFLADKGVTVEFVRRNEIDASTIEKARRADVLFNQKCLLRHSLAKKIIANSRRVIFDFDDAIYTRPGKPFSWLTQRKVNRRLRLWLQQAKAVTDANEFLAGYARRYSTAVEVIPMALDLDVWRPRAKPITDVVTIGWAGAPVNVPLLERLDPVLTAVCRKHPEVKVAVFSGRKPQLECPFEYHPYRPGGEPDFVRGLDIGLLPLAGDEYSKGKSPIKALQYLACGVPVVGDVHGATAEILKNDNSIAVAGESEWVAAIESLVADRQRAAAMGAAGREYVVDRHDFGILAERFSNILERE
jgi:glycosyltransferase involved in cell wall biosynthesis